MQNVLFHRNKKTDVDVFLFRCLLSSVEDRDVTICSHISKVLCFEYKRKGLKIQTKKCMCSRKTPEPDYTIFVFQLLTTMILGREKKQF